MKKLLLLINLIATIVFAQATSNSLLQNFKPFETPRTNCRPGTVYRISADGVKYIVQDVKQIKSDESNDGSLIGQMTFSSEELLNILNLNFSSDFITVEVEIKDAIREYTEQASVDFALYENDIAKDIMLDENSKYFVIRETVATKEIIFRFSKSSISQLTTGKSNLKEKSGEGIDFPFEMSKKFSELKRFFFLEEKIEKPSGGLF
ncbi:MAG: hypothetical protein KKF62_17830 [Bacteroidetes bacterium]|nr:hypothetical protein [Bacteroidota bacterium]MBU1116661.1 hypothetical protein [Bacteroidota bacterium]MBU1797488.1 hypothetical protein [Bacteroidota bacterium]